MGGCTDDRVTIMVLQVDLDCCRCYNKVKKLLCQFPQIRDQVYDEKQNTVTIKVVCCSPEKIRDKLYCKGGKSITTIEIKKPPPQNQPTPPKPEKPVPDKVQNPPPPKKSEPVWVLPYPPCQCPCPRPCPRSPPQYIPVATCCGWCYEGVPGGPCYTYGRPPPGYCVSRCDCLSQDNPSACSIM